MQELKHPYVGTEHLLLAILHNVDLNITKELLKFDLSYDRFRLEIIDVIGIGKKSNDIFLYTPLLKRVIENTILNNKDNEILIEVDDLFISLLDEGEGIANRILLGMNIDINFLYDKFVKSFNKRKIFCKKLLLEEFSINLNEKFRVDGFDPVIGRDSQVNRLIEILLRRTKNNPVLVGEAGVGKTAIVEEFVRRIELGNVPRKLLNAKVYSLSLASLIAGTKYRGEFEERINQIISEIENDSDVIIFIDEIHTLVGAGGAEGAIDASNILKPYLARGSIRVIGATTKNEYSKFIEQDKALDRRFQKINVLEMSVDETKDILLNIRDLYEKHHGVIVSDEIIDNIIKFSDRYIHNGKFPDKAIDVFDEVCAKTAIVDDDYDIKLKEMNTEVEDIRNKKNKLIIEHKFKEASLFRERQLELESKIDNLFLDMIGSNNLKEVTLDSLYQVIYDRTKIPLKAIYTFDKKNLFNKLSSCVVGQDNIIDNMLNCIEKWSFSNRNVPLSFLYVGKSGVGKTFLVKEYVKLMFNNESFIKLDMGEFTDEMSASKIIGVLPGYVGYKESKCLIDKVRDNPYVVILLDNIDKAHPKVLKIFNQILEDGLISDASGEEVDFKHTLIFMTTDYGCNVNKIGFSNENNCILDNVKKFIGESFYGRIANVLLFNDLSEYDIRKIIDLKTGEMEISTEIVDKIILESDYKKFGARKIESLVEDRISLMIEV